MNASTPNVSSVFRWSRSAAAVNFVPLITGVAHFFPSLSLIYTEELSLPSSYLVCMYTGVSPMQMHSSISRFSYFFKSIGSSLSEPPDIPIAIALLTVDLPAPTCPLTCIRLSGDCENSTVCACKMPSCLLSVSEISFGFIT